MRLTFCLLAAVTLTIDADFCLGQLVTADATGTDNFLDPGFYGVEFNSGPGFIARVTWDISAVDGAFFDFDLNGNFMGAPNPVLDRGSLTGMDAGDITFDWPDPLNDHPNMISASFAPGTFQMGDSFRFGADTDFLGGSPTNGSIFGELGAQFSVLFENGSLGFAAFEVSGKPNQSVAIVSIPEPGSSMVFVLALLAIATSRSKRQLASTDLG